MLSGSYDGDIVVGPSDSICKISMSKFTLFIRESFFIFSTSNKLFATFQKSERWCSWNRPRAWPNSCMTRNFCCSQFSERTIVGLDVSTTFVAWLPTSEQHLPPVRPNIAWIQNLKIVSIPFAKLTLMSADSGLPVFLKIGILGHILVFQAAAQSRILLMLNSPSSYFHFSCLGKSGLRKWTFRTSFLVQMLEFRA